MPALPVVSADECIRAFGRVGYAATRQKGSHVRLECPGRNPLTVPMHATLGRGLLRSLIREAGLSVDEFVGLLG